MKKNYFFTLLLTVSMVFASFGQVTLPHYDGFDYTIGADLGAQTNWENYSGDSNEIDVVSGSLSYSGLKASVGNSVFMQGGAFDSKLIFTEITAGEVFVSFLIKVTDISSITDLTDGGYFAILGNGDSSFHARLWVHPATDSSGTTFDFAYTNGSSGTGFGDAYNLNEDILVVMSYNTTSGSLNAWINPEASSFEAATAPTADLTDTDDSPNSVDRFLLRQDSTGETPGMIIDELRIGTTWAEVTTKEAVASVSKNSIEGFETYPNPISNGKVTISSASLSKKKVNIFNLLGKQVLSETFTGKSKLLDVTSLNAGIYILKVAEGTKVSTKKLVVR